MSEGWFKKIYKGVPTEFPPPLKINLGREYIISFLEDHPKEVIAGYRRPTVVVPVEVGTKKYSLYLSNVDLARQVWNIEKKLGSLKGLTLKVVKRKGPGRSYRYQTTQVK
jgi:hypothetical protein